MTILSYPADYSSVHDDLIYAVFDTHANDSTTYPNYKYIADIYINSTLVARVKKVQDPTSGIGVFNISQIVRNYLATSFSPDDSVLKAQTLGNGEFRVSVQVKFGEEYNYTVYPDLVTDSARTFYNHYNKRLVGSLTNLSSKLNKYASNSPLSGKVLLSTDFYFVPYFPTVSSPVTVTITVYYSGFGFGFDVSLTPSAAFDMQVLNISPAVINTLSPGAINSSTIYYTVTIATQTYRIDVICEPVYDVYHLHFLNQFGGFETKLFTKVSRKTLSITKKKFGKLPYTVDSSGNVSYRNNNNVYNETNSVYASQYKEKMILNSDLLTDAEYVWLADLVLSPMVYIQDGTYFYPVVINETNYEPKKNVNDELTNLTLDIEYGNQLNAQYR